MAPATTGRPGTFRAGPWLPSSGVNEAAYEAMSDAVLAVAGQQALEPVLERLVESARQLVGARYAALGVPDDEGTGFSRFLAAGMSDELVAAIGPLPRTHGLLGAMLTDPTPFRTDDITADPRFEWWPPAHPRMRSFMGVPIVSGERVVGAFYLTDKVEAPEFDDADQHLIELLAAHAAVAIENARLHEVSHELGVAEERNRLARELHDSLTQTLFSLALTADSVDSAAPAAGLDLVRQLARKAMAELRSLIFELRPADLAANGLAATLESQAEVLGRANDVAVTVRAEGDASLAPEVEQEVYRVVQQALHNAVRHAGADHIDILLDGRRFVVQDDGVGFDPAEPSLRSRHLGLISMEERAAALGGTLRIDSVPERGTTVTLELPGPS